jgi:hypothetical protein
MFHTEDPQMLCCPMVQNSVAQATRICAALHPHASTCAHACMRVCAYTHTHTHTHTIMFVVCRTPALYLRHPKFKFWPGDLVSCLRFFSFPQFFQQNTRIYLQLGHNHFLSHTSIIILPFAIICSNNHTII